MLEFERFDKIAISVKSRNIVRQILDENPRLAKILADSREESEVYKEIRRWAMERLEESPSALKYYKAEIQGREAFEALEWRGIAAIRILDYLDNAGKKFEDLNISGKAGVSDPFKQLWLAAKDGTGGAGEYFFEDMSRLFRQFSGKLKRELPSASKVKEWMARHPSGLDAEIIEIRKKNRERIIKVIIEKIDKGEKTDPKFKFEPGMSPQEKFEKALEWWDDRLFHLRFAVRGPDELNRALDYSLDPETMKVLYEAEKAGVPTFVNPYYLSLLNVGVPDSAGADLAVRDYVIYSRELVEEFGNITAWEKEDIVEPGKPNAAGWLLPSRRSVHRRYPDVAILIPDSIGRACGGLCASCQRMYEFQSGVLNFELEKLKPEDNWPEKLALFMAYFENDSQLRDILITGGDALMSSDNTLENILEAVYQMAVRKREANKKRKPGEKYAEMLRVRLGTRLPVYLPQRITPRLTKILADFKAKASQAGIKQFVIQTHFESSMEITPEARLGVERLVSAGWIVSNQLVFSAAASRRGHTAKLRQELNRIGVLPYYTFTVKGYSENSHNFATNGRAVQEQLEEKRIGAVSDSAYEIIENFSREPENILRNINLLKEKEGSPFLAVDRNVLNLPGVGKSLTYRVIGITRYGRRILAFDHDATRVHSPVIEKMGKVILAESKSVGEYLEQLEAMGEDAKEYESVYGYSLGETESRAPIYEYPEYDFDVTDELTNFETLQ